MTSLKFHDLTALATQDPLKASSPWKEDRVVTAPLVLGLELGVDLVTNGGLRSFLLNTLKSRAHVGLHVHGDKVFTTKQFHDFLHFCRDLGISLTVNSHRISDQPYWEAYSDLVSGVKLRYSGHDQKTFLSPVELLKWKTALSVEIVSTGNTFSSDFIFSERLKEMKEIREVLLTQGSPVREKIFISDDGSVYRNDVLSGSIYQMSAADL